VVCHVEAKKKDSGTAGAENERVAMALGILVGSSARAMPLEPQAWSAAVGLDAASDCKAAQMLQTLVSNRACSERARERLKRTERPVHCCDSRYPQLLLRATRSRADPRH